MNTEIKLIELTGLPGETVEQGPEEITLGELVSVEGATAEIVGAFLPSCAARTETLNVHINFRNTSPQAASARAGVDLVLPDRTIPRRGNGVMLEPGQSYNDLRGYDWLWGIYGIGEWDILRFEAVVEVYTPEGWVETDRFVGLPFQWTPSIPVPEVVDINTAPRPSAAPGEKVNVFVHVYNPGYTNPPTTYCELNEELGAQHLIEVNHDIHPEDTWCFLFSFIMGDYDEEIIAVPYRYVARARQAVPMAGKAKSFTIYGVEGARPQYHLDISINGEGLVLPEGVSGYHPEGTVIELTAYPTPGWWFHSWEDTDNNALNPTTVTMDRDRHIVCNFTQEAPRERRDPLDTFIRTMEGIRPKCPVGAIETAWIGLTEKVIEITPAVKILPPAEGER